RWLQIPRDLDDVVVIKIEPGHRPMRAGMQRLFLYRDGLTGAVELDDAIGLRIAHPIGEDGGAGARPGRLFQDAGQTGAVEDVVAEDERRRPITDELAPDDEGLRQAAGIGLLGIRDRNAP